MKFITLFLSLFLINFNSIASNIEKCGVYRAQGYLEKNKKNIALVLERRSNAEITVTLDSFKNSKDLIGTKVELLFEIKKPCQYQCRASFVKLVKALEPYAKPKSFLFPKPRPEKVMPCQ